MALVLELFSAFFWSFSVELLPYVIAFVLASHANLRVSGLTYYNNLFATQALLIPLSSYG